MNETKLNKIETLIQTLCPNGVEYKELGDIGRFYSGLSGKSKADFEGGNAKFITYMNVYSNIKVNTDIDIFVKVAENENQNIVKYGDVLFTGSSETPDECGMSSVMTEVIEEPLYLNSFCFGYRLNNIKMFIPDFLKYLFRDESIRKEIAKTASGVTRFNVSKKRFAKIQIPIPPIEIQEEIVNILDKFTQLEAELEAELEARNTQYEYYRNQLLNFDGQNVEWKTLGEVCEFKYGFTDKAKDNGDVRFVRITDINTNGKLIQGDKKYLTINDNNKDYILKKGDLLMARTGATFGKTMLFNEDYPAVYASFLIRIRFKNNNILPSYYWHFAQSSFYWNQANKLVGGGAQPQFNANVLQLIQIPIPPIEEQERIVGILDRFDALVNDISVGLPAEIEARRKQYEYYRGRLLDFKALE